MPIKFTPTKGSLLVSEPFMQDPNFQRSVVLLGEHHPVNGTLGYVLNQQTGLFVGDLFEELEGFDLPVYIGGPVEQQTIHFVHTVGEKITDSAPLGHELYWGGDLEEAIFQLKTGLIDGTQIKFFMGYAGWSAGQLEEELLANSWVVCNDYHPELVLLREGDAVWKEALIAMGPKFAHVANFPINPMWN